MSRNRKVLYNDAINKVADNVRVVRENGDQVGIMPVDDGIGKAYDEGKDLVLVAKQADPPVAKIIEYGKYKYKQSKKEKKRKSNTVELKEIRFTTQTQEHDLQFKTNHIQEFIDNGKEVKVNIRLSGRRDTPELAEQKIEQVLEYLDENTYQIKKPVNNQGRNVFVIIEPDK